jgi:DNA-binding SARP family transcriptional activator
MGQRFAKPGLPSASGRSYPSRVFRDAIEGLPDGVMVVDRTKKALFVNQALERLVGEDPSRSGHTCCEVFGCRVPGTGLENICVTEECLAEGPLPELRVQLPAAYPGRAVWVQAIPLAGADERVLLRARTSGQPVEGSQPDSRAVGTQLGILVLGRTKLDTVDGLVTGGWLDQRQGQLLKYLVCERHRAVQIEEIADDLWPGAGARGPSLVRHHVHGLRNRLEPWRPKRSPSSFVIHVPPGGYALNRELVSIDADAFETLAASAVQEAPEDPREGIEALERALAWYRGDLMSELPYAVWTFTERERLRDLALRVHRQLGFVLADEGDIEGAYSYLQRAAEMQPFDTDIERELITLALKNGRHSTAMRRYSALRARMLRRFGEEPDFQLSELTQGTRRP